MKFSRLPAFIQTISGLIFLSSLALTGCGSSDVVKSGDVNNSKIYRWYSVNFDEDTQATGAFAQFRVGGPTGTTVTLEKPSAISIVDSDLKLSGTEPRQVSANGTGYGWSLTGEPASSSYTFKWTNQSGAVTEDIVSMPANPAQPLLYNSKFNLPDGVTVALDRDSQSGTGYVRAIITGIDKVSQKETFTDKSISSGYSITFTPDEVAMFASGPAKLTIMTEVFKSASGGDSGSLGGKTYAGYKRKPVAIILTR